MDLNAANGMAFKGSSKVVLRAVCLIAIRRGVASTARVPAFDFDRDLGL